MVNDPYVKTVFCLLLSKKFLIKYVHQRELPLQGLDRDLHMTSGLDKALIMETQYSVGDNIDPAPVIILFMLM